MGDNTNIQGQVLFTRGLVRPFDTIIEAVESINLGIKVEEEVSLDLNIVEEF
jgi:hypothetical protein